MVVKVSRQYYDRLQHLLIYLMEKAGITQDQYHETLKRLQDRDPKSLEEDHILTVVDFLYSIEHVAQETDQMEQKPLEAPKA